MYQFFLLIPIKVQIKLNQIIGSVSRRWETLKVVFQKEIHLAVSRELLQYSNNILDKRILWNSI